MHRRRVPLGILLPIALLALVVSLATLQYRWIGTVSEAERDALRQSLARRAAEFAVDFDRQISRTFATFQAAADQLDPTAPEALATRFDDWRATAPFPDLVARVYHARPREQTVDLLVYAPESRSFTTTDWPAVLEPVKRQLSMTPIPLPATGGGSSRVFAFTSLSVLPDIPAFVIPIRRVDLMTARQVESEVKRATENAMIRQTERGPNVTVDLFRVRTDQPQLIVVLDGDYVRRTILPALVDKHFPDSSRFRVAVVDNTATPVVTRNLAGTAIDVMHADAMAPLFVLRPDLVPELGAARLAAVPGAAAGGLAVRSMPRAESQQFSVVMEKTGSPVEAARASMRVGGWRVLLQHATGSLDAAVAAARAKNLWLSFGILATLAASVGLIVFNARRSERLAARQMDFVATVSHELRTPLAVIRSAAQNLAAGVVHERDQARRYGDLIETEGRRLTDMVEQVLEFASSNANRQRLTRVDDVAALVGDAVESCAGLCESEGFAVDVTTDKDLPAIVGDEAALRRALGNLITNAVKYGGDGRWIGVSARAAGSKHHREVQISVSDRGHGIDPADLAHLFEPFYRGQQAVERQIHGNGLGLSLVKRIAESHGGRVTVKSAPGEGATFVLHLPAAPPDRAVAIREPATGTS